MLSAAKHLAADRDRPFAEFTLSATNGLRVTLRDSSNCQALFFTIEPCLKIQPSSVQPKGKYGMIHNRRASPILGHLPEQTMSVTRARMRATHVFISYSRANISFAQRLVTDLKRSGITVWVDQSGLQPGTPDWETALRDAIGKAHAVILIASEEARKSPYVKDELRLAHDVHHLPIYPFWVAGAQWINCIPLGWGGTQYIDARGGEAQYQGALQRLIAVLSGTNPVISLTPTSTPGHSPSYPILPQPTRASSGRRTATCLIASLVTVVLVGLLIFFVAVPLLTTLFHLNNSSSGQLTVTPTNINTTRTVGASNGCSYFSGSGWTCNVTLKNVSNSGTLTWTTSTSPSNVTTSPSTFPLSAQESMQVTINIPDNTCGQSDITFKGPQNIIHVIINCSG
jgi:TIR domain